MATVRRSKPRGRIEHVIVLMLENRSFDHMLGYLRHPDPSYVNLEEDPRSIPVDPADPDGPSVPTTSDAHPSLGVDPGHSPDDIRIQIYGTKNPAADAAITMNGFVSSYAEMIQTEPSDRAVGADIMRCFSEQTVPVLSGLAKHYAMMVRWFSSVPGETWPNRNFAHAGTSHGKNTIELDFYTDTTVFDRLGPGDWRVYHQGVPQVWVFPTMWMAEESRANFRDTRLLFADIADKDLPKYTFIEPDHGIGLYNGNSQHPSNNTSRGASFLGGEALIARIYNALAADVDFFASTLFLVTYDEHGGFYDREHPVQVVPPDEHVAQDGFDFSLSGVRVPAVAISPLIPGGWVDQRQFDHASIPRTVLAQFGLDEAWLTQRDKVATDLLDGLPLLDEPRTDRLEFAVPIAEADVESSTAKELNAFQASLVSLAGAVESLLDGGPPVTDPGSLPYKPTRATEDAARLRRLVPGSEAHRDIASVLARFGG